MVEKADWLGPEIRLDVTLKQEQTLARKRANDPRFAEAVALLRHMRHLLQPQKGRCAYQVTSVRERRVALSRY